MEYILNNGIKYPAIGFGTCKHDSDKDYQKVISEAIEVGYRYFDTASFYETERVLGAAIKDSGVARKDLIIATKLWYEETGYQGAKDAFNRSLDRLGLDYIDLYLIHWPKRSNDDETWKENVVATYKAMEEFQKQGLIKSLGLSNFLPHHLDVILENCEVKPVVDQLELHLGYTQEYALNYLKEKNILAQAWSPIGRGKAGFTESEMIKKIADKYGISNQKLSLIYLAQRGIMPIPMTTTKEHMKENMDIFDTKISKEDMSILTCMPQAGWLGEHPDFNVPVTKHVNLNQ